MAQQQLAEGVEQYKADIVPVQKTRWTEKDYFYYIGHSSGVIESEIFDFSPKKI